MSLPVKLILLCYLLGLTKSLIVVSVLLSQFVPGAKVIGITHIYMVFIIVIIMLLRVYKKSKLILNLIFIFIWVILLLILLKLILIGYISV